MIKQNLSRDQRGSHHVVLTLGIVVALIGVLGFVGYNSFMKRSSNAGSTSTLGRVNSTQSPKKDLAKLKADLKTASAEQKRAKNTYEAKFATVDSLVSGVSDSTDANYNNALRNQLNAEEAYNNALAAAKGNQNDAKVKKAKAALTKSNDLLKKANATRAARDAYRARLAKERLSDPLRSTIATMQEAKRALVPLEANVDATQAAVEAAQDAYDKQDNANTLTALVTAVNSLGVATTARDAQQEKVDVATTAYLDIVSTWDEYKAYTTNKESLVKARAELKSAKTKLQSANKKVKSLQEKIKAKTAQAQKNRK